MSVSLLKILVKQYYLNSQDKYKEYLRFTKDDLRFI